MKIRKFKKGLAAALCLVMVGCSMPVMTVQAVNPYLPLWEHIPDGEPRVFGDRVYIYGSHDSQRNSTYCGYEYVVWSAPVDDLNNWTYHGESFNCGGLLYAPDVVEKDGKYYLYTYDLSHGNHVAVSDKPEGPFVETSGTRVGADPAVLVDDDGRVYAYWGYQNCYAAELDPNDMATILPGTQINNLIPSCNNTSPDNVFQYYEGASIRKIGDKYCLVYCQKPDQGSDPGVIHNNYRGRLVYALSDKPLGPYTYGGVIIDNGGELLEDGTLSYRDGNNHGGIMEIEDEWYVFYHRMTNNSEFSRQAMVEPIEVNEQTGEIKQAEMTSQGFNGGPLNAYEKYSAAIACYLTGSAYVTSAYTDNKDLNPITNITDGSVAGIKYVDFETNRQEDKILQLQMDIMPKGANGRIDVRLDDPVTGELIGSINVSANSPNEYYTAKTQVKNVEGNKHKLFFVFNSEEKGRQICDVNNFEFTYIDSMLSDDFEGTLDKWSEQGDISIGDGNITMTDIATLTAKEGSLWDKYNYTADVTLVNGNIGLQFRKMDDDNYYTMQLNSNNNTVALSKTVNGKTSMIEQIPYVLDNNTEYQVGVECNGNTILMFIDQTMIAATFDNSLNNGTVGLMTETDDQAIVSRVTVLPANEQTLRIDRINVGGKPLPGFTPSIDHYTVMVENGMIPRISALSSDEEVSVSLEQASTLPGVATVTFASGGTSKTYKIQFLKPPVVDDFMEGWTILNENSENYKVHENGLTITSEAGDLGADAKNIFLKNEMPGEDWIVTTKLNLSHQLKEKYQQTGILMYMADNTWVRFNYEYGNSNGTGQLQILEVNNGSWGSNPIKVPCDKLEVYLQLKKVGNSYEANYSFDGKTFSNIRTLESSINTPGKLAIYALDANAGASNHFDANYEYLEIYDLTPGEAELEPEPQPLAFNMTLSGVDQVKSGEKFSLTVGTDNADKPMYATELLLKFDPELFDLEGIEAINPTQIVERLELNQDGVRILTFTEGGVTGSLEQLVINFKAKDIEEEAQKGDIEVNNASVGVVVEDVSSKVEAISTTKEVVVKGEIPKPSVPEDINQDEAINIADLALVAYYYTRTSADIDWEQAKRADVNNDGIVNILDLTQVAEKILGQ